MEAIVSQEILLDKSFIEKYVIIGPILVVGNGSGIGWNWNRKVTGNIFALILARHNYG